MKTIDEYMRLSYKIEIVEDKDEGWYAVDEGGYAVSFLELPGCTTCGETIESAVSNAYDAKGYGWKRPLRKV